MIDERRLVVVSGPSGCGKDTVVRRLMAQRKDVFLSVSCTTRKMRAGEADGVDYYYISEEEFLRRVRENRMLEYTKYAGNYYGTPLDELRQKLCGDNTVVLIIEVEGAMNVKRIFPDSLCVFIVPPSLEALEQRLRQRSTEPEEDIRARLEIAQRELTQLNFYDVSIVNDVVETCASALSASIDAWQNKQPEKGSK
ncbi:MAG: guanylate kinase [Oscillospiraceae bacterium]|nr:guanylate kinase [Oscillospiraceae bacterium]